uniref:Uncharacterized protein n=1 Tax=Tetranychus urticae TaxID=32264 RepID=T1KEG4_TETUR
MIGFTISNIFWIIFVLTFHGQLSTSAQVNKSSVSPNQSTNSFSAGLPKSNREYDVKSSLAHIDPTRDIARDKITPQNADRLYQFLKTKGVNLRVFDALNQCLETLSFELKKRDKLVEHLKAKVEKIWVTNQPQSIETTLRVNGNVYVKGSLMATKIQITLPFNKNKLSSQVFEKRVDRAWKEVKVIEDQIKNRVVRKDRDKQMINGDIHFLGPIKANRVIIESIKPTTMINGITLNELKNNVLRKSGNQKVTGHWTFESGLYVDDLKVNGLLSGINISNVLQTNSAVEQVITGRLKIHHGSFNSLAFESINDINREELVLKSRLHQKITGPKQFTNVSSMANINLTGKLNGYDWNHLVRHSINIHRPSSMISSLQFDTAPSIKTLQARSVNNLIIENLNHGLTPEELNHLSGSKTFKSLAASRVTLNGKLNNLQFPNDLVTLRTLNSMPTIVLDGNISFASSLTIAKINDIDINRDVVRRSAIEPQVIHGTKIFDSSIKVSNIISKQTKLRRINLNDVESMMYDQSIVKRSNVVYEDQLFINGSLQVDEINGIQINSLLDSLFSKSRDQKISWGTQFNGLLSIESVHTKEINGLSIPDDLVQVNSGVTGKRITGRKIFEHIILGSGDLQMKGKILNGNPWNSIAETVIKNGPDNRKECYGKKTFSSIDVMGNIIAEKINNLVLKRDVMLINEKQTLSGKWYFGDNIKMNHISFTSLNVSTINSLSIDDQLNRLVLHDQPSVTLENKDFRGGLFADDIVLDGKINGVNLTNIESTVVTLDSPQAIYSSLRFEDEVIFHHAINTRSVNGHDLHVHFKNDKTRSAARNLTINGNVFVNGSIICGTLNNKYAEYLKNYIHVSKYDNQFNRPVVVNSTVTVDYLTIDGEAQLDGIHPEDLIRLDQRIELDGSLTINGNAHVDSQLIVGSGIINNCSLQEILKSSRPDYSQRINIPDPINFSELNILGNLRLIDQTINHVDIDHVESQTIRGSDEQSLNALITFDDDIQVDELYTSDKINGIDIMSIYEDSVKKSAPFQKITGKKVFKALQIKNGDVLFKGNLIVAGLVNNFNLTKLNNEIIKPSDSHHVIRGRKIFYSDKPIVLTNVKTPVLAQVNFSDIVLSYMNETITTSTNFTQPITVESLEIRRHQTRSPNTESLSDTVKVEFKDPVTVEKLIVKQINGIPIEKFASTTGSSILKGNYSITGRVYIRGNLVTGPQSYINETDLTILSHDLVNMKEAATAAKLLREIRIRNESQQGFSAAAKLEKAVEKVGSTVESQILEIQRISRSIGEPRLKYEYFDYVDNFNEFDIDADHIDNILISRDYRLEGDQFSSSPHSIQSDLWFGRSIYLWFADRTDSCVRRTFSFDILGIKKLKERLTNRMGQDFPPVIFSMNNHSISLSAWSNSSSQECDKKHLSSGPEYSHIIIGYTNGSNLNDSFYAQDSYDIIPVQIFSDIKYFIDSQQIYAVTLQPELNSDASVLVYRCTSRQFHESSNCEQIGSIKSSRVVSIELFYSTIFRTTLLTVLEKPLNCSFQPAIFYYAWSSKEQRFVHHGSIFASSPTEMSFIEVVPSKKVYLIVANTLEAGFCSKDKIQMHNSSSMVNVYMLSNSDSLLIQAELRQSFPLNVISMSSFKLGPGQVYLVFSSKSSGKLYFYQYHEGKEFVQIQTQDNRDGEIVQCFWFSSQELIMLTTTTNKEKAKVYKAFISGLNSF